MRENIQFLVFWARLMSLRMIFSNSIHLPANDNISFKKSVFIPDCSLALFWGIIQLKACLKILYRSSVVVHRLMAIDGVVVLQGE
jgi:hypothetical protein